MTRPSSNIDQKLLQAARELLPQTGISKLSVRMVARKAGVNPGMFNYHFKTKEAFIERLISETYEQFFKTFSIEATQGENCLEQLKNAIFTIAVFARDNRHLIATIIEDIILGNERIIEFLRKNMTKHVAILLRLLKQCQKEGYIVKIPLYNLLPIMAASVIGPNIVVRLAEQRVKSNFKLSMLLKIIGSQMLKDKSIKQRIDIVFKGLRP